MDLLAFAPDEIRKFLLILLRVGGIVFTMPLFGDRLVPAQVKIGLALFLTLLLLGVVPVDPAVFPVQPLALVAFAFKELLLGIMAGFVFRVLFGTLAAAGQLIGFQMGFGIANVTYPGFEFQGSVVSAFFNMLGILLFFAVDAHYLFLRMLQRSFELIPVSQGVHLGAGVQTLCIELIRTFFRLTIEIALPTTFMLLAVSMTLGIIARLTPQLNIFVLSFPLTIQVGLLMLLLGLPPMALVIADSMKTFGKDLVRLLQGTP
ncbi:MAG: flagellar biosynthetic protein FliR [Nitrospirota bacterium]|nr:flagellar biosynthetic protein FliR [Nitrospirota bacterium]